MTELNQNKNLKQLDRPDTVKKKTLFYIGNKWMAQLIKLFMHVLKNRC